MFDLITGQTVSLQGIETRIEVNVTPGGLQEGGLGLILFALDERGLVIGEESVLEESSASIAGGAIRFDQPNAILLDLPQVSPAIVKMAIAVYLKPKNAQHLALDAFQEIQACIQERETSCYRLDCRQRPEAAMVLLEIYRRGTGWKARAVGQGFVRGLRKLMENFGFSLPEAPSIAPLRPFSSASYVMGTGFCVHPEGYLLTNWHVIEDGGHFEAFSTRVQLKLQLIFADPINDLALLKADQPLPAVTFRDGRSVGIGEQVMAVGFPLGNLLGTTPSVTVGNVSSLVAIKDDTRSLRFTAPIQQGNSGGPLLDLSGLVVGVVVAKLSADHLHDMTGDLPENVNFAIKTALVRSFLEAAGVECQLALVSNPRQTSEIAQEACRHVYRIACRR